MFVLACIFVVQIGVLFYLRHAPSNALPEDWAAFQAKADSVIAALNASSADTSGLFGPPENKGFRFHGSGRKDSLFAFDPNSLSLEGWKLLGLSAGQANAIIRYREKGVRFRVKQDLRKIKVIRPEKLEALIPYVNLPDSHRADRLIKKYDAPLKIDIASADSSAFEKLRGIGPAMAGRIVRYRERLGGFVSPEQLKEVWGMDDTLYNLLLDQAGFERSIPFRRIRLNSSPEDSIRMHPYVGYKIARQISAYRSQHPFTAINELRSLPLVTDEIYRKLAPYLELP